MYPTQDTSRVGTARMKQEKEADTRIIARNMEERSVGIGRGKILKSLTSAKDLTIELPEGRYSPYHIAD